MSGSSYAQLSWEQLLRRQKFVYLIREFAPEQPDEEISGVGTHGVRLTKTRRMVIDKLIFMWPGQKGRLCWG